MDGRTAASSFFFFFFSHILSFYNCPKGSGIKLSTDIVSPASLYCLFLPLSLIGFISVVTTIPHECKKAPFIIRSSTGYEAIGACSSEQLLTAPLLMHLFFFVPVWPFSFEFLCGEVDFHQWFSKATGLVCLYPGSCVTFSKRCFYQNKWAVETCRKVAYVPAFTRRAPYSVRSKSAE